MRTSKLYREWKEHRDKEIGLPSTVKVICDACGERWVESVKVTLPPCPACGGDEVYEYQTLQVG